MKCIFKIYNLTFMKRFCMIFSLILLARGSIEFGPRDNAHTDESLRSIAQKAKSSGVFILNKQPISSDRQLGQRFSDPYDDKIIFPKVGSYSSTTILDSARMDEMNSNILTFDYSLDELKSRLHTFRRNSPAAIPDEVRIAAFDVYVVNAQIMKDLGVLDEEEEDSSASKDYKNYYSDSLDQRKLHIKRVKNQNQKTRRAISKNAFRNYSGKQQTKKSTNAYRKLTGSISDVLNKSKVIGTKEVPESLDRGNGLDFGELNTMQSESLTPSFEITKVERQLKNIKTRKLNKPSIKHNSQKVNHKNDINLARLVPEKLSIQQKLRQDDELLELARQGSLFDIDFNSIYNVQANDIENAFNSPLIKRTRGLSHSVKI
jgi:hypothetical protein